MGASTRAQRRTRRRATRWLVHKLLIHPHFATNFGKRQESHAYEATTYRMTHQPGDVIQQQARGQLFGYQLLCVEAYTNRFGYPSHLLTWHATCALCGRTFQTKSGRRPKSLPRTCEVHRGQFGSSVAKRI
jgi:hypothetical protein